MNHKILYFLDHQTGKLYTGIHKPAFRNNGDEIKSRYYFDVEDEEISKIEVDSYFESNLDMARVTYGDYGFSIGYSIMGVIRAKLFSNKNGKMKGERILTVHSSYEKANKINTELLLPLLIKEQEKDINDAQNKFFNELNKLQSLENLMKKGVT